MILNRLVPEIERATDRRLRRTLRVMAMRRMWMTAPFGFLLGLMLAIPSLILAIYIDDLFYAYRMISEVWIYAVVFFLCCVCAQTVIAMLLRRHARRAVRVALSAHGASTCLVCGYDLRGNVSGRCPECGTECRLLT